MVILCCNLLQALSLPEEIRILLALHREELAEVNQSHFPQSTISAIAPNLEQ